jgi:hypothetical protein
MTHVSSVTDSSYAYLATLSRLDANGDGVLSVGERAADEKPGILKELLQNDNDVAADSQPKFSGSVMSMMMEIRDNGSQNSISVPYPLQQVWQGVGSDLYRNTYGEFDLAPAA